VECKGKSRGNVALVLVASVLGLLLIFAVASSAITQLNLTTHQGNATQARNAAESAVHTAIAKLLADRSFGVPHSGSEMSVAVSHGHANGTVTFDPESKLTISLNNIDSDTPKEGWERLIPGEAVQLVGVGHCNGVERRVEAIVGIPRYPAVITTTGDFLVEGPLVVGVVRRGEDATAVENADLLPGDLVSNSPKTTAVQLNPKVTIYGDVITMGSVQRAQADVRGATRDHAEAQPIPKINIRDYDPNTRLDVSSPDIIAESTIGSSTLAGWNRREGGLHVYGDLELQSGILYLNGNIQIHGALKGKGAIISTGSIQVDGITDLEPDNQIALVAKNDVRLLGDGRFRGLVYTEGNFRSDKVELLGAFVANGEETGKGSVELHDVGMVASDPTLQFGGPWLAMERRLVSRDRAYLNNEYTGPVPTVYMDSKFVGKTDDGHMEVEWRMVAECGQGNQSMSAGTRVISDVYDADGQRIRTEVSADETQGTGSGRFGPHDHMGNLVRFEAEGVTEGAYPFSVPEALIPTRVEVYEEVSEFHLDFSQFLQFEEQVRMLLWVES
jgi:hypothetical protein